MTRLMIYLAMLLPLCSFAQNWKTFSDTSILFTAKYPVDWINKIKEGKKVFFTSPSEGKDDTFAENINISVTTNPAYGTTLKINDAIESILDNVKKSFIEFTEESVTAIKWNDADAFEITYSGNTKSNATLWVRITQRLCFYKTRLYLVTYVALKSGDNFAATAKQIINTIEFKE
jgi:hypothetical protein